MLEYSAAHLDWQLQRAGFVNCVVELHDFTHVPHERVDPGALGGGGSSPANPHAIGTTSSPWQPRPRSR